MHKYNNLFSAGHIGSVSLKNRVVMAPMGTLLCGANGEVSDQLVKYYEKRAAGGTGLIVVEVACVESVLGKAVSAQICIDDDRFIPGLSRLAGAVQKYGSKIFLQLHHAGNQSNSSVTGGKQIVAPSSVTNSAVGELPRELTTEEVKDLVRKFVNAAVRAQKAGMDGVELHGAHGYLICEFLSPHTNRRDDQYGGNFENRMRLATEIIKGTKEKCGNDFPVIVRFSADEFTGKGIDLQQGKVIAQALEFAGADALDISAGTYESMQTVIEPLTFSEGWKVYLAEEIRNVVNIPVIAVGAIKRPVTAENILKEQRADFIALGRALLCDPEWVNKAVEEKDDEIIPCIGCMYCVDTIFSSKRIQCAVRAKTGRELEFTYLKKSGNNRIVSVLGGGPAGMESARVLSLRGFKPILYEKERQLGGELIPGSAPPDKEPITWYKNALVKNLLNTETTIHLETRATPELVKKDNPYAVIVAIGGKPTIPSHIEGIESSNVFNAIDILRNQDIINPDDFVVIIGGGMTGCETAELLERKGTHVTIVEIMPELLTETNGAARTAMIDRLIQNPKIDLKTNYKLKAVHERQVELSDTRQPGSIKLPADKVIIATGLSPTHEEIAKWKQAFERVVVVGDAVKPSNVAFAIRTAFDNAFVMR